MEKSKFLKYTSFALLAIMIVILMAATVIEKIYGSSLVYTSPVTITIWALLALSSLAYLITCRTWKQVMTFGIHVSFLLILCGALVTHCCGRQGKIHLRTDAEPTDYFTCQDGKTVTMPFSVGLDDFESVCYTGTSAPMDYVSTIMIFDRNREMTATVSMNKIHKYRHYRFYQSGFDKDTKGTVLSVSYDPWGIFLTYSGYLLLLTCMAGFFLQKGSRFRTLLRHPSLSKIVVVLLIVFSSTEISSAAGSSPKTISREAADAFGDLYICYNDRICPMQTLARDFTVKIYGKLTYKGLSAEQVLAGWFFYYDNWKNEPMIKIKGEDARRVLGTEGKYARLTDFADEDGYKLDRLFQSGEISNMKNIRAADEKFNIISMVCTGSLLRIYPYSVDGNEPMWYSLADRLPAEIPYEEWVFITSSMNYVAEKVAMKDNDGLISLLRQIRQYQKSRGGESIPAEGVFMAEKVYENINFTRPLAMFCMTLGIIVFMIFCLSGRKLRLLTGGTNVLCLLIFTYLTFSLSLRWYVSGHVPLSNGYETMQFMAWTCLLTCLLIQRRFRMALPVGLLCCGLTLMVSMMGESNPQITRLIPVLHSPLLSIHVMVIMLSYTLFAFMMLCGVAGIIHIVWRDSGKAEYLKTVSNIMLYPAVFLLAAGIFIGAVWANISWGRYWGWDPKEVWALITMLIYSLGLHQKSLKWFKSPLNFHIFSILAFLSVLITYFGVNFILGGMHSYA